MRRRVRGYQTVRGLASVGVVILAGIVSCQEDGAFFERSPELRPFPQLNAGTGGGLSGPSDTSDRVDAGGASGSSGADPDDPGGGGEPGGGADGSAADAGGEGGDDAPSAGGTGGVVVPLPSDDSCGLQCARNGGRCFEETCFFDCDAVDSCTTEQVLCPLTGACEVRCGNRSCVNNVVCGAFGECTVSCEGELSCAAEVICEGECDITCSGARSCRGGIGGSVQLLELECSGAQSCGGLVQCEGDDCQLSCSGAQSCAQVNTFGAENSLDCSGPSSCDSSVTCLGVTCSVTCAENACASGIDCQALDCELPNDDD